MNTPGQNANAVAELVFGFMIYQSRKQFSGSSGTELRGKNWCGRFWQYRQARGSNRQSAMGMEVCAYDKFIEAHVMQEKGIKPLATIEDVFEECHYISLHIPAVSDTKAQ